MLGVYSLIESLPAFDLKFLLLSVFLHQEEVTAVSNACRVGRGKELTRDELIFV